VFGNSVDSYVGNTSSAGSSVLNPTPLGIPLPNVTHAVSVSMPRWSDVVAYEEGDERVHTSLQSGYPRFVFHPLVRQLFNRFKERFACSREQDLIVLVTERAARRCQEFLLGAGFSETRIESCEASDLFAVIYPMEAAGAAKQFWQHTGWIVSSRCAEALLFGREAIKPNVERTLRERLSSYAGILPDSLTLFPSGMAAIDTAHQVLAALAAERGSPCEGIQYGFPYLDTLKIQEKFGHRVRLLARADADDFKQLVALVDEGKVSHVFTEAPCNPLLQTPQLAQLSHLLRPHGIPLVVDDTIGTCFNIDVTPFADIVVTSLTKFISGGGDVAAGSLMVSPASPLAQKLTTLLSSITPHQSYLFADDAEVVLHNSADFPERMARINSNAELLALYLRGHPLVDTVYYPKFSGRQEYEELRRDKGSFGGLLSIVLKDAANAAPHFYDALELSKGPGLGTAFTLACPYTLLAHYGELDWAEDQGVSRYLIRVSVGVEDPRAIIAAFERALATVSGQGSDI
jgi:cystathionine gamma-synthase